MCFRGGGRRALGLSMVKFCGTIYAVLGGLVGDALAQVGGRHLSLEETPRGDTARRFEYSLKRSAQVS